AGEPSGGSHRGHRLHRTGGAPSHENVAGCPSSFPVTSLDCGRRPDTHPGRLDGKGADKPRRTTNWPGHRAGWWAVFLLAFEPYTPCMNPIDIDSSTQCEPTAWI